MSLQTDDAGRLLIQFMEERGLSTPVIASYNHTVNFRLRQIIESKQLITNSGRVITLSNPVITRPLYTNKEPGSLGKTEDMLPATARAQSLNYFGMIFIKLTFNERDKVTGILHPIEGQSAEVALGQIPIMIGSEFDTLYGLTKQQRAEKQEPEYDPQGYFIVHLERLLLNIERLRLNSPMLYEDKGIFTVRYTARTLLDKTIIEVGEKDNDLLMLFSGMKMGMKINVFYIFYALLGFDLGRNVIEYALNYMHSFIQDTDPQRLARRKKEFNQYMTTAIASFRFSSGGGNPEAVFNTILGKFDKNAVADIRFIPATGQKGASSPELELKIRTAVFKNISYPPVKRGQNDLEILAEGSSKIHAKLRLLAYMIVKFVDFRNGYRKIDDRDSYANKMIEDAGAHIESRFLDIFNEVMADAKTKVEKGKIENIDYISSLIKSELFRTKFDKAFVRNLWSKSNAAKPVVTVDILTRESLLASYAHIRRITTPMNKQSTIRGKRLLTATQWGSVCPIATPEGSSVGLVKDSASLLWISLEHDDTEIRKRLESILAQGSSAAVPQGSSAGSAIFVNGIPIGFGNTKSIRNEVLIWRRTQLIPWDTGIILDQMNDLWIYTNRGRCCRPVLIVEVDTNGRMEVLIDKLRLRGAPVQTLMDRGVVEYIDVAEQLNTNFIVASTIDKINVANDALEFAKDNPVLYEEMLRSPKYSHMEISPNVILGISAITLPMPHMASSVRATYQSSMSKAALGSDAIRNQLRFETTTKIMNQPGVPFVSTDAHELFGLDRYPAGRNIIIAIMPFYGMNQEDAIVFNSASIDRGLFHYTITHSYKITILAGKRDIKEEIGIPDKKSVRFSKLDNNGIVRMKARIKPGDALVGKTTIDTSDPVNPKVRDTSLYAEIGKIGVVDEIQIIDDPDGGKMVKIRLREYYSPKVGDKFALRYAQKGVISKLVSEQNMPFIESSNPALNGVKPDVIFSPLGFPSRQTPNLFYEMILGRITAMTGIRINGTAFQKFDLSKFLEQLVELNFHKDSKEVFISGETGERIQSMVFTGVSYYLQLRHLVEQKHQARSTGAVQYLTRQPVAGIRKKGATRSSFMEISAMQEHGAAYLMQERLSKASDAYTFTFCTDCGNYAYVHSEKGTKECIGCQKEDESKKVNLKRIEMPYSMKLLTNILSGMGIKLKYVISS
ncbi:MAG: DNA-directed RNA polymerase subunit RPB2 [Solivirus sp.]|uniref:DNA-directed RNA polymerase n=1 Tax=Solivirus sp. TaxID=2487772 RepID=A0A3G5AI33_9VIRU|nr:MAG: DNA-directed RNA polymerase subunit RPB2 [Solivirus sp.]